MVFPFVPVTPSTRIERDGSPKNRAAIGPSALRTRATRAWVTATDERSFDQERDRAALDRGGGVVMAVVDGTRDAAEQRAARRAAAVVHDVGHLDLRVPGELEQVDGVEEVVQVHGILSVTERAWERYRPGCAAA